MNNKNKIELIFDIHNILNNSFIQIEIWNYLNCKDICNFLMSSFYIYNLNLLKNVNKMFNHKIIFNLNDESSFLVQKLYLNNMLNNFPYICKLEINSYYNLYTTTFLSDLLLEKYIYKNDCLINSLKELKLSIQCSKSLHGITNLINLEHLNLESNKHLNTYDLNYIIGLTNLKHLNLNDCYKIENDYYLAYFLNEVRSITTIEFDGTNISGSIFFYLSISTNIVNINCQDCKYIHKNFITNIIKCQHIIKLNLNYTKINDNDVKTLTKCLVNLEELHMDYIKSIRNNKCLYEIKNLKNLKVLSLSGMKCNNKFLQVISKSLHKLISIDLNYNEYIKGDDLYELLHLENLSYLFIYKVCLLNIKHIEVFVGKNVKCLPLSIFECKVFNVPPDFENYRDYN